MQSLTLIRPDDWHVHLRDNDALERTVKDMARVMGRAIVMPNLTPPITTVAMAESYHQRILSHMPEERAFAPLMVLYLTDQPVPQIFAPPKLHSAFMRPNFIPRAPRPTVMPVWAI